MTLDVVVAKLATLAERLQMVRKHRLDSADAYVGNPEARDLVAFNLMLAVQAASDLAAHVVASEGLVPWQTIGNAFERVAQHGVITAELANQLRRAVGFRNVVAHGYTQLDLNSLHEASFRGAAQLEDFARQTAAWAHRRYV